jgi:RNA polymerase sigma-70 factor (ECF subfamily)
MTDDPTPRLLARWRTGDQQAAYDLFRRHVDQLIALARSRLSARLAQRVDGEDVVQSAYRSFFVGVREGRYAVERGGDLWRLLVGLTLHKLHRQVRRNRADKRALEREVHLELDRDTDSGNLSPEFFAREPTPIQGVALAELIEQIMGELEPLERRMFELRLQGCNLEEIASATQRSQRTVTRVLKEVKQLLNQCQAPCDGP